MGDWPAQQNSAIHRGVVGIMDPWLPLGGVRMLGNTGFTNTTWTAQRAVFLPIVVQEPSVVTHLAAQVTTQAGNWNMGIYEEDGSSVVLGTKTSVPAAGLGSFNITDTTLMPGVYYIGLWCDSSSAAFNSVTYAIPLMRVSGAQQQTSLASDLPATATFATYATAVAPGMYAMLRATF